MPFTLAYSSYAILAVVVVLAIETVRRRLLKPPYPPGPKGLPLIGNIYDTPPTYEWLAYAKWTREFNSDIIHLNLLGSHLIILNSAEAASDLLDKRSAIYSDRPRFPMLAELVGWGIFSLFPYNNRWRTARKLITQFFSTEAVKEFYPKMTKATHVMLHRLAQDPDQYKQHAQFFAASLSLDVAYGIDVKSRDDPYMVMVDKSAAALTQAGIPGSFLVDSIPWLKYVPEWVPGAGFKKKAKIWRIPVEETTHVPFNYVKKTMASGTYTRSVTSLALEQVGNDKDPDSDEIIRSVSTAVFAGGSDTTLSVMTSFLLAMVLHPDVQKEAQKEIDRVVGQDRLPTMSDLPSLPYVNALANEVHRWNPSTPLGLVHRLMKDDMYKGYFIPAGSLVLGNIWAILHDETMYKDPSKFNPGRYLKDGKLNPNVKPPDAAFGFGRRICPGKSFVNSSINLTLASILATFDIGKAVGEDGKVITPTAEYTTGLLRHPVPFKYTMKVRSKQALDLITHNYNAHFSQ